jgi:hypothetical protein
MMKSNTTNNTNAAGVQQQSPLHYGFPNHSEDDFDLFAFAGSAEVIPNKSSILQLSRQSTPVLLFSSQTTPEASYNATITEATTTTEFKEAIIEQNNATSCTDSTSKRRKRTKNESSSTNLDKDEIRKIRNRASAAASRKKNIEKMQNLESIVAAQESRIALLEQQLAVKDSTIHALELKLQSHTGKPEMENKEKKLKFSS